MSARDLERRNMLAWEEQMRKPVSELFPTGPTQTLMCKGCGKEFEISRSAPGGKSRQFCTSNCKTNFFKGKAR